MRLAEAFGAHVARTGVRLVYGGGGVGLMGAAARAAYENGGRVLGVIPKFLAAPEIMYEDIDQIVVATLHDRKRVMADQSDAFAVLPGGIGTLEEAIEVLSWARLGLHAKPVVFVDDNGYWNGFFDMIQQQIKAGFTPPEFQNMVSRVRTPEDAIERAFGVLAAA